MSIEATRQTYISGFATGWAAYDPTWDQKTRIHWPPTKEDFKEPQAPWLRVIFGDVEGFNDAIGVLDTQIALFTVDIYVPLATESADLLGTLALEVRRVIRLIPTPSNANPKDLGFRRFGRTETGFAHGRVKLELDYTLPDFA